MSKMEVDLALNSRKFQAGVKDAEKELENLQDAIEDLVDSSDDLERAASNSTDEMGDGAKDAERDIKDLTREVEDLTDEFKDATRKVDDLGDKADSAADQARRGFKRAEDGVEEFKDEANSTAREAAASFDGSAESIGDAFQEVAANAFAGFGPAGALAGIAAAAGIGLAVAGFENMNEESEESRERAAEWGQAYIEAGDTVLGAATRIQMAQDIITDPERWTEAKDNAKEWGVSVATAVAAMTGETWALEAAQSSLTERQEEAVTQSEAYTDAYGNVSFVQEGANQELRNGQAALDAINREMENGAAQADTYSQALVDMARNTDGATSSVDEFGDTVYALPDGTTVYVDAETGRATRDVDAIERRIYGIPDGHATVNVSTSRADANLNAWMRRQRSVNVTVNTIARNGQRLAV